MNKLPLRLRLPLYAATIVGFSLSAFAYLDLAADRYHLTSKAGGASRLYGEVSNTQ